MTTTQSNLDQALAMLHQIETNIGQPGEQRTEGEMVLWDRLMVDALRLLHGESIMREYSMEPQNESLGEWLEDTKSPALPLWQRRASVGVDLVERRPS